MERSTQKAKVYEIGFLLGLLIIVAASFLIFYFGVPTIINKISKDSQKEVISIKVNT